MGIMNTKLFNKAKEFIMKDKMYFEAIDKKLQLKRQVIFNLYLKYCIHALQDMELEKEITLYEHYTILETIADDVADSYRSDGIHGSLSASLFLSEEEVFKHCAEIKEKLEKQFHIVEKLNEIENQMAENDKEYKQWKFENAEIK